MFSGDASKIFSYRFLVLALAIAMAVIVLTALAFEHIGGYIPCKLCLEQREPWYAAIPVGSAAALGAFMRWPHFVTKGLIMVCGLLMVYSLALAIRHAGVEWSWWPGPGDCGVVEGGIAPTTGALLQQLDETIPPSCDDAALRVLGLSFAGWNAVGSLSLALAIFWLMLNTRSQ